MNIFVDKSGTVAGFTTLIEEALTERETRSLLILTCDGNDFSAENLDAVLKNIPVPVFGGVFPSLFHGAEHMRMGTIVVSMSRPAELHYIPGMSDPKADYEQLLDDTVGDDLDIQTLLVFVDGLSTRIAAFIDALYAIFGLELNYVGGGAGSLSFKQSPCIITNDGLKQDGGIVAAFPMRSGIGVSHGWETVGGPYKVTESVRNIIKTLDWRPAYEVYKEAVNSHNQVSFKENPFFDIAKAYSFGIAQMKSERVVRDILSVGDDGSLICVAEVPEGEYVDILHGKTDKLIAAAGQAYAKALAAFPAGQVGIELFFDCISRALFLDDQFPDEISKVYREGTPMVGACSIGEIANSGDDYLEFYNKTSVVAFLEDA